MEIGDRVRFVLGRFVNKPRPVGAIIDIVTTYPGSPTYRVKWDRYSTEMLFHDTEIAPLSAVERLAEITKGELYESSG